MSPLKNIVLFGIVFTLVLGSSIVAYAEEIPQAPGPTDSSGPQSDPGVGSVPTPKPRILPAPGPKTYPNETRGEIASSGVRRLDDKKAARPGEVQVLKKEIQGIKDDRREAVVGEKKAIREDVRTIRDDVKNGSTTREDGRDEARKRLEDGRTAISAEREKARGEIELKREEMKTTAERVRAEHFAKIGEMYVKRYLAAYDRLINIKDRVIAHIEKVEEKGQNASAAKTELDKATPLLAKALTSIDELKTALTAVANNPSDTTLKTASQEKAEAAKTALKEAHAALINVIEMLKPAKPAGTATSSAKTI